MLTTFHCRRCDNAQAAAVALSKCKTFLSMIQSCSAMPVHVQ